MVRYARTSMQTIQSATVVSTALLNWSKDVGPLSPGHYADRVAVRNDPLAGIGALEPIDHVMKGGAIVR